MRAPNESGDAARVVFQKTDFPRVPALLFFDENGNGVFKTDALVLRQRMMHSLLCVVERAYEKGGDLSTAGEIEGHRTKSNESR